MEFSSRDAQSLTPIPLPSTVRPAHSPRFSSSVTLSSNDDYELSGPSSIIAIPRPSALEQQISPKAPKRPRIFTRLLTGLCLLAVFYLNLWLGIALLCRMLVPPYSYTISEWLSQQSSSTDISPFCTVDYESRRRLLRNFNAAWVGVAFVQETGPFLVTQLTTITQSRCLSLICAFFTILCTLSMIAGQIYLVRQWRASPCDKTPLNSMEAKMNRGFFVTQVITVLIDWYIFTVWSKPFGTLWPRKSSDQDAPDQSERWESCRLSNESTTAR